MERKTSPNLCACWTHETTVHLTLYECSPIGNLLRSELGTNKMSDQVPEKREEVTEIEFKQTALARAEESGWRVGLNDCQVQKVLPPSQVINEIGLGSTTIKNPVTKWIVHITPKTPPNRFTAPLRVTVEF